MSSLEFVFDLTPTLPVKGFPAPQYVAHLLSFAGGNQTIPLIHLSVSIAFSFFRIQELDFNKIMHCKLSSHTVPQSLFWWILRYIFSWLCGCELISGKVSFVQECNIPNCLLATRKGCCASQVNIFTWTLCLDFHLTPWPLSSLNLLACIFTRPLGLFFSLDLYAYIFTWPLWIWIVKKIHF